VLCCVFGIPDTRISKAWEFEEGVVCDLKWNVLFE
jgi:hypothetical protein